MDARLTISFIQKPYEEAMFYELQVVYERDNQDCTQFINDYLNWSLYQSPWPFPRIDTLSFTEYREMFLEDIDSVKSELIKVKSMTFKRMRAEETKDSILTKKGCRFRIICKIFRPERPSEHNY